MKNREVNISGIKNVRTIGEIENQEGKCLKPVFYRSAGLHGLTDEGIAELKALGITDIIDLRSTGEASAHPDNIGDLNGHHVPILDFVHSEIDPSVFASITKMEDLYVLILEEFPKQFKQVFDLITNLDENSKALYHCTVGKDRTGLLSMFLLSIAGVDREEIIEDYALTGNVAEVGPNSNDLDRAPNFLFESPKSAMRNTLAWLDENHGGPLGYLLKIGVDEKQQAVVRRFMGL